MTKLPDNWQVVPLHSVAKIQTGLAKGKVYNAETVRLPYLRVANVQDGFLDLSEIKTIEVLPSEIERYRLRYEDVLLTEGGDADKLGRGDVWKDQLPLCLHQNHIFVVRTHQEVLDPYFFSYQTSSPYGKAYFLASSKQSTNLASINSTQLKDFPVLLPPLPEQHKIAAILSTWDAAITLTEQLIAEIQIYKRTLSQILLGGDTRHNWQTLILSDVVKIIMSNVDKKSQDDELAVKLCNYMDVYRHNYITNALSFMQATAKPSEISKFKLFKNDVIITKDSETAGDIAQAAVVIEELDNVICGYHLSILRPHVHLIDGRFLRELLSTEPVRYQFQSAANGVTRYGLTLNGISKIELSIPMSLLDQRKLADILGACDEWIDNLEQYLNLIRTQKRGLMQQLLTGAVRVRED